MKQALQNMQRIVASSLFVLICSFSVNQTFAQVDVTASAGTTNSTYTTLKAAFDAINAGTHQGTISIGISANTTETAPAVLNSNGAGSAVYTSVLIQPTVDAVSISGATATGRGVIELKGADNVTINGDNPNTGATNRNLTIQNTAANNITLTSVIRIANAATVVTSSNGFNISNCILTGNATGRNTAGTASTTGSENNTFGIYVGGNGGTTAIDAPTALTGVATSTIPTATTVNDFIVSNNVVNAVARAIVFNGSEIANSNSVSITNNAIGDQATTITSYPFTTPVTTVYTKAILVNGLNSAIITGNSIKNIVSYVATGISGIELNSLIGSGTINISNNTIDGVSLNAVASNTARAISVLAASAPYTISGNTIRNVQNSAGSAATRASAIFVNTSASSATISNNNVSKICNNNTGTFGASAVILGGGNNITVQNNMIYDVNQNITGGAAFSTTFGVNGLNIASGTGHKVYHNSIHLSGALLGTATSSHLTAALLIAGTGQTGMDIRSNIFSNTMTGGTTSIAHVAIFLPSGAGSGMNLILNNNAYYCGTTAASQGIAQVGTTAGTGFYLPGNFIQGATAPANNLRSYTSTLNVAGTNDNASLANSAAAPFVSATDLHLSTGVTPTQLESGGANIGVTTDIDGQTRPGPVGSVNGGATAPDMGADEFDGVPLTAPIVTLNSVTPPTTAQCTASTRLVSVNVANNSGTVVSVNLAYAFNGVAQTPIAMTNVSGTTWEATIPAGVPATAVVTWAVAATNSFTLTGTYSGTAYSDEPQTGVIGTATNSASVVCSGSPSILTATAKKPGAATIGSGSTSSTGNAAQTPFYGGYGGVKTQYIIRASELTAAGLTAGNITSLGLTVTGAGATLSGFAINVEQTALTALTGTIETVNNQVYSNASYAPTLGVNTFNFISPLNWDGTSNLIISFCWSNNNTSNTATNVLISSTSFVSGNARFVDSRTSAEVCGYTGSATPAGWNGGSITVSSRPIFILTGYLSTPISSISWSDGATTVGTTNPLTVNPTTTTTYTATIGVGGCPAVSTPSTTVTVNPLPSAPTATNSAQCGTQVPTASVASTSGLPTPSFVWYSASTGGTVMQNSTSATYTSTVASTTTFYVAELNTATGCESARTAVTVTVASADGILASIDNATICVGSSANLSVVNTNGTPNQTYTYTWTNAQTGSGLTSQGGANITVTPTQAGTYTYDVAGVDGGCNAISSINLTVNPFTVVVTPINITCNGYNNGSLSLGATTCGTSDVVSVDGGAFGPIPTNLTPGTHAVVVRNTAGFSSASQNITITEPSTTISTPSGTNAAVCQNATTANVSASSTTNTTSSNTINVSFGLAGQPAVIGTSTVPTTTAGNPNVIATATLPALPAGAVVTNVTFTMNGLTPIPNSWSNDVYFGFSGSYAADYNNGNGAPGSATPFNFTRVYTGTYNLAGGTVSLHYYDRYDDIVGGAECTFPTGASVANLAITYTVPNTATISWWDAATGGTQVGTGSPLNAVGTSVLPNTSTPGTYTLYAQGEYSGCSSVNRTAVTVTVNALPTVNAGTDQTVCSGTSVTLAGSGATSYSWNNGITNNTPFTATATTTYTVTGTDGNGCTNTDQVLVTVNALPTVNAGADQAICAGGTATLTGTGTATGYAWNNGVSNGVAFTPASTLTYTVTGTDGNGCTNTDQVVVTVNALPTVGAGTDQTVCSGTSVTLNGSGATSYAWDNGVTNGTPFTATATTTYTVTGTDGNGCTNTDQVVINVNALPTVNAGTDQTVCAGTSVTLTASGTATGYAWDNSVTNGVAFTPLATATYTVTGTDGNGCTNTDQVTVTVNALPTVNAGADQSACSGSSVTLTGTGTATGYAWNNGVTNGVAFTPMSTMTYTVTGTDGNGCTNTDQVTVTVGNPTSGTDVQTACDSYTWIDGVTYTASNNTATFTLTNAAGCDSVVTLNLTINNSTTGTDVQTACDSYTWIDGVTYTASNNTATFTLTNAAGCDSVVTLNLTINNSTAGTDVQTACDSYTWIDGVTYTASNNTATFTLTNAAGCDSVVTLNLTINNSTTGTDVQTACGTYTWIDGVTYTASNNTATFTLTNAAGCDSIVTLNLTINALPSATATDNGDATITASTGTSYQWVNCTTGLAVGGATSQTFAPVANGSYAVVVTNAAGCSDTSSCVNITNVGVKEFSTEFISVYPNPTHNNVTITMTAAEATVVVVDGQGKTLKTLNVQNGEQVSLEEYATGVYFLNITTEFGTQLLKIAKH